MRFQTLFNTLQAVEHRPEVETCAEAFQPGLDRSGCRRVQQGRHDLFARCNQLHLVTAKDQVIGEFTADQAGTEQQHPTFAGRCRTKARVVFEVVDREHGVRRITFDGHAHGFGAPGQDQVAVDHRFFTDPQALVARVDAADARVGAYFGLELFGHGAGFGHTQAVGILVFAKAGGEHRLGVGAPVIGGNQQQRGFAIEFAKLAGHVVASEPGANDYDRCVHS
ncbi:hypothetical protein D3C84_420480 [compost metagenome]